MRGAILPLPQYVFMAWCLVKHRDNFAFYIDKWTLYQVLNENTLHYVRQECINKCMHVVTTELYLWLIQ